MTFLMRELGRRSTAVIFRIQPILICAAVWLTPLGAQADDVAAPSQPTGTHSKVSTTDGGIRDDELVKHICDEINKKGKNNIKDVKLMVNSCYGGGILDDMEKAFGAGGACEGIPWVGGTASAPDQTARGWSNEQVDANPGLRLGSGWTNGLVGPPGSTVGSNGGALHGGSSGNNVLSDLRKAGNRDLAGPNGSSAETPQVASGNGGDGIMWNMEGGKHEAIVFGGLQTDKRHSNNISNVKSALDSLWDGSPHNIQDIDGGSSTDLKVAITDAVARLDANTQLVIYIDDHGAQTFDFDEAIGGILGVLIDEPQKLHVDIPRSWLAGWFGMYFGQPTEFPQPWLELYWSFCEYCEYWDYYLGGQHLYFPMSGPVNMRRIPLDFYNVRPGPQYLDIIPRLPPSQQGLGGSKTQALTGGLTLENLELSTGPVNEIDMDSNLVPGQSAAFYNSGRSGEGIFLELLENGVAVVYMFTYDNNGDQLWMLGVGEQTGEGVIVEWLLQPTGPSFGAGYDPDDLVYNDFGFLGMHLPACGATFGGSLFISPEFDTGFEIFGDFGYSQLTNIVDCNSGTGAANSGFSGSWYDPSHDGEGIILEVLTDGRALVQWFTYDGDGKQMWIQGIGTFNGNKLTVDAMFTTSGAVWGSGFDPGQVVSTPWGSVMMTFGDCSTATVMYDSNSFGSGTLNMQRLTSLMGIPCD